MSNRKVILLPCQGTPVAQVWLPPSRNIQDLYVEVWGSDIRHAVQRYAVSLGLTVVRPLGEFADLSLSVWIARLQPGQQPRDLQAVAVREARHDRALGVILDRLDRQLGCVTGH